MPIASPFHERTSQLCTSLKWKDWSGYYAVCSYDTHHDREYFAFRNACGLIDVTPLFKYEVTGKDATRFLSRVMVKNIAKLKHNQVTYCCWCDDDGKVVDDGTVWRLEEDRYIVTAAEPSLSWFERYKRGYQAEIKDISQNLASVALQGPNSRALLNEITETELEKLKFFRLVHTKLDGKPVMITRTGYTGDLGYEIWCDNKDALPVWDSIMANGKSHGVQPCGLDALDVTRVEAGFIMNGVDYQSANHCIVESRKSTPYEIGLDWTVNLDREHFVGQEALLKEKKEGSKKVLRGLEMDWVEYEKICWEYKLPPQICSQAWRHYIPIYNQSGKQVGYGTSGAWSPILKKNLVIVSLDPAYADYGTNLQMETTVEYYRRTVSAKVVQTPFFNPERKRM